MASHALGDEFQDLVDRVYQTAVEPESWPDFLRILAAKVGGVMPGMVFGGPDPRAIALDCTPARVRQFEQHYAPRIERLAHREAVFGGWCYSRFRTGLFDELRADWANPLGVDDCLSGHVLVGNILVGFGIWRELGAPPFGTAQIDLVDALLPHTGRAVWLAERLAETTRQRAVAFAGLDQLRGAVVLVDERGRILAANEAAGVIAAREEVLRLDRDGLHASRSAEDAALMRLVRQAVATARGEGTQPGGVLVLARDGRRPLELVVTPLPRAAGLAFGRRRAAAAVFVRDSEDGPAPPAIWLRQLYGLTAVEARLASALGGGEALEAAAERLAIARATARNHLKRIFEKTDTHRQAELVALLLAAPTQLREEPQDP
jgi:DNA-binding CsgD family transcriptional regulator